MLIETQLIPKDIRNMLPLLCLRATNTIMREIPNMIWLVKDAQVFLFRQPYARKSKQGQLQDSHYGSLQNPVPVFFYCFVSGKRRFKGPDSDYDPKNPLHVALDSVNTDFNRLYVEKYLTRIIDEDELTRLYGKR